MEEFLDGILIHGEKSVPALTQTGVLSLSLPADYKRGSANPDLTGFQIYCESAGASFNWTFARLLDAPFQAVYAATTQSILLSGLQTIDGIELSQGNRVFVKNQIDPTENGIYEASSGAWTLASNSSLNDVWVLNGAVNAETAWSLVDLTKIENAFVIEAAGPPNLVTMGVVLDSGNHVNALDVGWETVRFAAPVVVTNLTVSSTYYLKLANDSPSWPADKIRYRILAAVADSGTDIFGNIVRANVNRNKASNLLAPNTFWMSKANPSKFAVESLYFDHLTEVTMDSMEVEPLTPGMLMSVYYTSEGDPGTTPEEWDNKLWNRVPRTHRLIYKNRFSFPQPIKARYVKLEFTDLKARPYDPGSFNIETEYRKHPKWVLDYFLVDMERKRMDDLIPTTVDVVHDAYALAFSYYMDEQRPLAPGELGKIDNFEKFLARNDLINQVDADTLSRISYSFSMTTRNPESANRSILGNALAGLYRVKQPAATNGGASSDVEEMLGAASDAIMTDVSTLNREKLMEELRYPEMFFFINCRHVYRKVRATFKQQRAYFAGVKSVRFIRDTYSDNASPMIYNETFADVTNVEINDFA